MEPFSRLPPELERQLNDELEAGETVLWTDRPAPARLARLARPQFLAGIPYTLFALFWETAVVTMLLVPLLRHGVRGTGSVIGIGIGTLFPLIGLMALANGVSLLLTPWKQRRNAEQTLYALTNRRALLLQSGPGATRSQALMPEQFQGRTRIQERNGSGDLLFPHAGTVILNEPWPGLGGNRNQGRNAAVSVGFYGIADVRAVDDLIRRTFEDAKTV
ncbi:MAG: hypothetical protein M3Y28_00475 [Armatimonadota bacterium]|nr:hypothetical protein [Armatimonadota bacterium]